MEFITIESNVYERYVNKIRVTYKYWVSESNIWWYSYDDIVDYLKLSNVFANDTFDELEEYEKTFCYDGNVFDKYGNKCSELKRWVTSEAIRKIINRNNDRGNALVKSINNLECEQDAEYLYNDYNELNGRLDRIFSAYGEKDFEECFAQIHMITKTETYRDTLDKVGIIDKNIEAMVDEYRDILYDDYDEVGVKVTKNNESKEVHYRKNKESTCPTWLKDCLR